MSTEKRHLHDALCLRLIVASVLTKFEGMPMKSYKMLRVVAVNFLDVYLKTHQNVKNSIKYLTN